MAGAARAGLRAARGLAGAGVAVTVLEARDRVVGRGYSVSLGGRTVELGGSWFTPEHDQVRAELARYGMSVRAYPPVQSARWLTAGELRLGAPVPWHELAALEAALARVRDDAERVAAGDQALAALSAAAYVERLQPSDALRDFLLGWWQLMGGASPHHGAAHDALAVIHEHGGLTGLLTCLAHGPLSGWSALAEAMARDVVDLRLGTAVETVEHGAAGVVCTTEGGEVIEAGALVLAIPLNCLPAIG